MATTTIDQQREAFLQERRLGIGGSDAASLFPDDSKYGCPTRLFYDKRGTRPDYERTDKEKRILERGNRFEDTVADLFTREYGFKVRRHQTRVMPGAPHMRVNIDRQIINVTKEELLLFWPQIEKYLMAAIGDGQLGPGVLECKTSNEWVAREAIKSGIIPDYIFQLQHGMLVTDYKWGVMAILDTSSLELTCFVIVRNEAMVNLIRERGDQFWALVENGPKPEPPNFPQGDTRCRSCIFRKTCRGEQYLMQLAGEKPDTGYVSDDSFSELVSDLRAIKEQGAVITATEKEIIARIQERMEAASIAKLEVPSVGARIRWAEQKAPVKWDTKALEAEGGTIAREAAFGAYIAENHPELLSTWLEQVKGKSFHLADQYKHPGKPSRPFVFASL